MPQKRLPKQTLYVEVNIKKPVEQSQTRSRLLRILVGTVWDLVQAKWSCVGEPRNGPRLCNLDLLSPKHFRKSGLRKKKSFVHDLKFSVI